MPTFQHGALALSYVDEGEGAPVVLLHSGGLSSRQWGKLLARLRGSRRVIAPDFLGYGTSSGWPADAPFHFEDDVALVEALAATLPGPVDLVGHSYGGLLALRLALRRPEAVRSIAVFEPVTFGVLHDPPDAEALADLARTDSEGTFLDDATGGKEPWLERFVDYWNGEGAWRALPEPSRENFRTVGRKLFQEVRSLLHDRLPASAYRALEAPTLLLHGTASPLSAQRVCARLAAALPRATLRPVEGAGHMGPISHAAAVNEIVAAHLAAQA
jgi:pimeloyl-ACP methyl ester carboxylesterase